MRSARATRGADRSERAPRPSMPIVYTAAFGPATAARSVPIARRRLLQQPPQRGALLGAQRPEHLVLDVLDRLLGAVQGLHAGTP